MTDNLYLGHPTQNDIDNKMYSQNYFGPGVYEHYKGGKYIVFGLQKIEHDLSEVVVYMTLDAGRQRDNWYMGYFSIGRPLHFSDGPDPFNSLVWPALPENFTIERFAAPISEHPANIVPRFRKLT